MTKNATKIYEVTVIDRFYAHYRVEAEDARAAADNWGDGEFAGRDDNAFDDEGPCGVCARATAPGGRCRNRSGRTSRRSSASTPTRSTGSENSTMAPGNTASRFPTT